MEMTEAAMSPVGLEVRQPYVGRSPGLWILDCPPPCDHAWAPHLKVLQGCARGVGWALDMSAAQEGQNPGYKPRQDGLAM